MKRQIVLLVLLLSITFSYAQGTFTINAGIDPLNAFAGSAPTNYVPALDFKLRGIARDKHIEVTAQYESFTSIDYRSFFFGTNYIISKDYLLINRDHQLISKLNVNFVLGTEGGMIIRNNQQTFLTGGFNSEFRVFFGKFGLGLQGTYTYRPEYNCWRYSTTVNTFLKL